MNIVQSSIQVSLAKLSSSDSRLGLMLSGGIDSGVLLSYLVMELKKTGLQKELVLFTVATSQQTIEHACRVVSAAEEAFEFPLRKPRSVGNNLCHHSLQVVSGIEEVFDENLADVIFLGDNRIPEISELGQDPWAPKRVLAEIPEVHQPFFNFTKDQIVSAALNDNLKFILELSHSCTEQGEGRCGVCWQCRERAWAFKSLNLVDPGVL